MAYREYGIDNGDGTITVWATDDNGNHWPVRTETRQQNQGGGGASSGGGQYGSAGGWTDENGITVLPTVPPTYSVNGRQTWDYNQALGWRSLPTLPSGPSYGPSVGGGGGAASGGVGGGGYDWSSLWNGLTGSNQAQFDLSKEQFNANLYSNLMQALLNGAVSLSGVPEDWLKYATYTNGGQNIFKSLYGSTPSSPFAAPTGVSNQKTIDQLLADLGLSGASSAGGGGTGGPGMYQTANGWKTVQQMRDEVVNASGGMDLWRNAPDDQIIGKYLTLTGQPVTPWTEQTAGSQADAGTTTAAVDENMVPLPHQINPAVWDSMSDTAKRMILASAGEGNTPSGVWTETDFLNQLNAARPVGTAPKSTRFNWGESKPLY